MRLEFLEYSLELDEPTIIRHLKHHLSALPPLAKGFKHPPLFHLDLKLILFPKVIRQRGKEQDSQWALLDFRQYGFDRRNRA